MKKRLALFTSSLLLLAPVVLTAQETTSDGRDARSPELIVDINLEFIMQSPQTAWGADLFRKRPGFANYTPAEEKFTLQGIARNRDGSTAVIDGKVFKSGDALGSRRIAEIGPNFVILEKGDSQVELVLPAAHGAETAISGRKQ